jgi:hypothetical protein
VTRFAPVELFTARTPALCRILEIMRVVVVFPLVPVIAADPRGSLREISVSTPGATLRATTPGTVDPPPLPSVLLASRAMRAAATAAKRRALSKGLLTKRRLYPAAQGPLRWNSRNRKT